MQYYRPYILGGTVEDIPQIYIYPNVFYSAAEITEVFVVFESEIIVGKVLKICIVHLY